MDLVFIHLDEVFYQLIPVGVSMFVYIDFALVEKSSAHLGRFMCLRSSTTVAEFFK
jgi:hypothetical protein